MPWVRIAVVAWLATGASLPAAAHAILLDSQPAARATTPAGPTYIRLRFNSRIDQGRSRLELRRPGVAPTVVALAPAAPDSLAATVALTAGEYVLRWQVLAIDGHITRGDVPFTVRAP